MAEQLRVIVAGASGRMGRMLVAAVAEHRQACLVGATERHDSAYLGRDAGELANAGTLGVRIVDSLDDCAEADVLIDFTTPNATLANARYVAAQGMAMVIGTTGFSAEQLGELRLALAGAPVVMAANYSVGVNLALNLIRQAARVLGDDYDAEIYEAHHRHKVDAPSGTALAMGKAVAEGRQVALDEVAVYAREGITGARERGAIGFSVVRGGNIVGEHRVMFIADEERVELAHVAADRAVFAKGALRAAVWLRDRRPGWYSMQDVLSLNA
ncbi:MAG: 4-hydroxy-tetrahydrodipicolinate reductase [Zetaproteobacteria bacterium]|nr:MAG: 4-hydroxy-tetrahydrodipicolinate reductase [Zetaproteobacteria bacterium]